MVFDVILFGLRMCHGSNQVCMSSHGSMSSFYVLSCFDVVVSAGVVCLNWSNTFRKKNKKCSSVCSLREVRQLVSFVQMNVGFEIMPMLKN